MQHASPASSAVCARSTSLVFPLISRLVSLCLLLCLTAALPAVLTGCAAKTDEGVVQPARPDTPCDKLYTYAPGFLVMELAAGSDIFVDPAARDFPVFCTKEDALNHVLVMVSSGKLPRGDWEVYGLNGSYAELGCSRENGGFYLCKPARIVDWHPHEPVGIETRTGTAEETPAASVRKAPRRVAARPAVQAPAPAQAQPEAATALPAAQAAGQRGPATQVPAPVQAQHEAATALPATQPAGQREPAAQAPAPAQAQPEAATTLPATQAAGQREPAVQAPTPAQAQPEAATTLPAGQRQAAAQSKDQPAATSAAQPAGQSEGQPEGQPAGQPAQ